MDTCANEQRTVPPSQVVIVVDQIMWTGNLGSAILRVQQAGQDAATDDLHKKSVPERIPQAGDVAAAGEATEATKKFLEFSLEQIEAMIGLVRGDLDK